MFALGSDCLLDRAAVPADLQNLARVHAIGLADKNGLPGMADSCVSPRKREKP